jgi:hypothetical protein
MTIYNTKDDAWQVVVDNRLQGHQITVSFWNGDDFETRYDAYVIADSLYEGITDALQIAGMDWDTAEFQVNEWGITRPDDGDTCQTCGDLIAGSNPFSTHCDTCLERIN